MFCSRECCTSSNAKKEEFNAECYICGTKIKRKQSDINKNKKFYCSIECRNKGSIGENNPNYKGKSKIGNCDYCSKEIVITKYVDKKNNYCSQECKSKHQAIILKGENNPNYKHGKRIKK